MANSILLKLTSSESTSPKLTSLPWLYWAKHAPDRIALKFGDDIFTWQQLSENIVCLSAGLRQQGVREKQIVVLRSKNTYEALMMYLATLHIGAWILPVNPQLPQSLLSQLLPKLGAVFIWDNATDKFSLSLRELAFKNVSDDAFSDSAVAMEEGATLTLTSGSSGLPKAALHKISAHLENASGVLERMSYGHQDCWLLSLPLFHVSGQGIVWRWLLKGGQLSVQSGESLNEALSGCTHASLVPTQLIRLLQEPLLSLTLKEVLLGGAAIPLELTQQAEKKGIRCWCGYGMTEMASTVCAKMTDGLPGVGIPLPGREIRLVDEEIWVRGSGMSQGYWRDGTLVSVQDEEGWFHTRDRGAMENGELRIYGRLDNLFFSAGEGIQPENIERILQEHPLISQVFIIPVPDEAFGHRPVAVIDADTVLSLEEVTKWLLNKIPRFQLPVGCYPLPEELKQSGGIKISRKAVMAWLESTELKSLD